MFRFVSSYAAGSNVMTNLSVTKIDAAKRQLNTAIVLFFDEGDAVSIHALSAAAYQILQDIGKAKIDFDTLAGAECVKEEKKKEFRDLLFKARNFFKHADRDPDAILDFDPWQSELFLYDSMRIYYHLTGKQTVEMRFYNLWFMMRYPGYFNYPKDPKGLLFQLFDTFKSKVDPVKLESYGRVLKMMKDRFKQETNPPPHLEL